MVGETRMLTVHPSNKQSQSHLFLFLQPPDDRNVVVEIRREGGRQRVNFMNSHNPHYQLTIPLPFRIQVAGLP